MKLIPKLDCSQIEGIDKECIELCDVLNSIKGIETFESCCGHGKDEFMIWFKCTDFTSLARVTRACNRNYSSGKFYIKSDDSDVSPTNMFSLMSYAPIKPEEMETECHNLAKSIKYWCGDTFDKYFNDSEEIHLSDLVTILQKIQELKEQINFYSEVLNTKIEVQDSFNYIFGKEKVPISMKLTNSELEGIVFLRIEEYKKRLEHYKRKLDSLLGNIPKPPTIVS